MIFGHRPAVAEAMARQAHADGPQANRLHIQRGRHGHFSPATCGTERVITLPREKPSHMELRVGAKRRSRYRGGGGGYCTFELTLVQKTVLNFSGLGVSFQAQTICPEVVERPFDRLTVLSNVEGHLHFCIYGSSPTEQVF